MRDESEEKKKNYTKNRKFIVSWESRKQRCIHETRQYYGRGTVCIHENKLYWSNTCSGFNDLGQLSLFLVYTKSKALKSYLSATQI